MSTAAYPGPPDPAHDPAHDESSGRLLAFEDYRARPQPPAPTASAAHVRRRGSLEQGRALETLGHAVEYLIDGGMFNRETDTSANQAAIQILMRLSRAVFQECPEVMPVRRRLGQWGQRVVARALRRA